ncbi:hypothetical protein [Lapidilactobacillus salsurivasis]
MRGSPSIGDSLQNGLSAQTAVITLSGWSGEIRGEIAVTPTASSPRISQRKPWTNKCPFGVVRQCKLI